jgi:hypothetical protein
LLLSRLVANSFAVLSAIFNSYRPIIDGRNTPGHISPYNAMAVTTQLRGTISLSSIHLIANFYHPIENPSPN